jgi:hypothetical protein
MGELHARLAVLSASVADGLAAAEAWVLGAASLPQAASIKTRASPALFIPSQTLAGASPLLETIAVETPDDVLEPQTKFSTAVPTRAKRLPNGPKRDRNRPFSRSQNVMVGPARFELVISWSQTGG